MTFTLYLDEPAWQAQQDSLLRELPGIVPVVKGNGYGMGRQRLARQCRRLGVPCVAVGTPSEVRDVRSEHSGDVLILQPMVRDRVDAAVAQTADKPWLIRTVAHLEALARLAALASQGVATPRVVVELDTPVHRHGISWQDAADLRDLRDLLAHVPHEGIALHLPIEGPRESVAHEVLDRMAAARIDPRTLWVSHLGKREVQGLAARVAVPVRPRIGTLLWHGDRSAWRVAGTVLDVHPLRRGAAVGYRGRRASTSGSLIVVSGGTDHAVALRGPTNTTGNWKRRLHAMASGVAHGSGLTLSPFSWQGRRLHFADVPHMQVSMLVVPEELPSPRIGDEVECQIRMTIATFDEIRLVGGSEADAVA